MRVSGVVNEWDEIGFPVSNGVFFPRRDVEGDGKGSFFDEKLNRSASSDGGILVRIIQNSCNVFCPYGANDIALFIGVEQRLHIIQISGFALEEIHILDGRGRQYPFRFSFIEIIPQSLRYFDWAGHCIEEAEERICVGLILGCG